MSGSNFKRPPPTRVFPDYWWAIALNSTFGIPIVHYEDKYKMSPEPALQRQAPSSFPTHALNNKQRSRPNLKNGGRDEYSILRTHSMINNQSDKRILK